MRTLLFIVFNLLIFNIFSQYFLPCIFENNLISLSVASSEADTLHFYLDTGGKNFFYKSGLKKLGIGNSKKNLWNKSNIETLFANQKLPIADEKEIYLVEAGLSKFDGMLGREWFANKIWKFDYVNQKFSNIDTIEDSSIIQDNIVQLNFKREISGNHTFHLPRIQIIVDSDTLSVLFDTGAQANLSDEAQEELQKNKLIATSFINATTFDKWSEKHPEWKVVKDADVSFESKSDMIIVPSVKIGNKTISSVEFVKRDDINFKTMSDIFMDKEIVGAIGGNAFLQLKTFLIDYRGERLIL